MQILLNTDACFDDREAMREHLDAVVTEVLGQFATRISCVKAHLTDANGATLTGLRDIHCSLVAQAVGLEPVVARHHAGTAQQAMHGALRKLGCNLAFEFEKLDLQFAFPAYAVPTPAQAVA